MYDFSALKKKSFVARVTLPLISAEHKTKITEHCILKAFRKSMEEEEDDANEYHPAWKAPPVRRTFRLEEFFSLCELSYPDAALYKLLIMRFQSIVTIAAQLLYSSTNSGTMFTRSTKSLTRRNSPSPWNLSRDSVLVAVSSSILKIRVISSKVLVEDLR